MEGIEDYLQTKNWIEYDKCMCKREDKDNWLVGRLLYNETLDVRNNKCSLCDMEIHGGNNKGKKVSGIYEKYVISESRRIIQDTEDKKKMKDEKGKK